MYLNLCTNKDSYEWDKTGVFGSIDGELFLEIDGIIFPDKGWVDIVSSVLIMWADNIISMLQSNSNAQVKDFCFM